MRGLWMADVLVDIHVYVYSGHDKTSAGAMHLYYAIAACNNIVNRLCLDLIWVLCAVLTCRFGCDILWFIIRLP